jgi:DNA-binding transcriptional MerR regulator
LRCLRDTGMPIAQMQRYADLCRTGEATFAERIELLEEHDRAVQAQIGVLRAQQQHIRDKIKYYRGQS